VLGAVAHRERADNVVVGPEGFDDAAVVRAPNGSLIVQSADFFTPIVDDPYAFGAIAAANALSDLYAMGATPLFALNIVAFPADLLGPEVLSEILQGGADKAAEAGISIVGGHSIDDEEPKYGLVVTGTATEQGLWRNAGAREGDALILTKPLGSGIYTTAIKRQKLGDDGVAEVIAVMSHLNRVAAEVGARFEVHGATDVTGFGLLGHLLELANASDVSLALDFDAIPSLPLALGLAETGVVPGGTRKNLEFVAPHVGFGGALSEAQQLLLADAQTSGGLVLAVAAAQADALLDALHEAGETASSVIGRCQTRGDVPILVG